MLLQDKVALITGGASGIGRAIAIVMAREGATILVADMNESEGHKTVELIKNARAKAAFVHLSITEPEQHFYAVEQAQKLFGKLDIACNNAGISVGRSKSYRPIGDSSVEDWLDIMDVNLNGVYYGLRAQIPALMKNGGGAIVNTASIMGQVAGKRLGAYVASKHGVVGLTKCAALDYAHEGIRVNTIGPGYIDTPMLRFKDDAQRDELSTKHPLGRLGKPHEVAELVAWLSSDRASFVTGAYYPVDGGYLAQ